MSEKRFTLDDEENGLCRCILVDGEEIPTCEICELLNEQQATITAQKKGLDEYMDNIIALSKENEQLRQFINKGRRLSVKELMDNINENELLKKKIKGLEKENEQLRKTIKEAQELLFEEVDLFSEKATEHDIIAYKEMNEFDNKDAYYMCISTKKVLKMLQRWLE